MNSFFDEYGKNQKPKVTNNYPPKVKKQKSGCLTCLFGFLIMNIIFLLIIGGLIWGAYYFLTNFKKAEPGDYFKVDNINDPVLDCKDSLSCVQESIENCKKAKGVSDLGDFAEMELEVVGKSGTSCVVYAKILEIKELPESMSLIPSFVSDSVFKDLSMECLVPQSVYTQGIEKIGEYVKENSTESCKGSLIEMLDKLNIDLSKI